MTREELLRRVVIIAKMKGIDADEVFLSVRADTHPVVVLLYVVTHQWAFVENGQDEGHACRLAWASVIARLERDAYRASKALSEARGFSDE